MDQDGRKLVDFLEFMEELQLYAAGGVLSELQYSIVHDKAANGTTYSEFVRFYELSCPNVLVTCFLRTVQGRRWEKSMDGGDQTYLSDVDILKFQSLAINAADDASCLSTAIASSIAYKLKSQRIKKAKFMLCVLNM